MNRRPDATCIYNNGIVCSSFYFYDKAKSAYVIDESLCANCGWNPKVCARRKERLRENNGKLSLNASRNEVTEVERENARLRVENDYLRSQNLGLLQTIDETRKELMETRYRNVRLQMEMRERNEG